MSHATEPHAPAAVHATPQQRDAHEALLLDLTHTPTAAGREHRVTQKIRRWCDEREDLRLSADDAGNVVIEHANATPPADTPPLFITAHTDHPAFVLEHAADAGRLLLSFRGGVLDAYFDNARIVLYTDDDRPVRAVVVSTAGPAKDDAMSPDSKFLRTCVAAVNEEDRDAAADLRAGDIGRWDFPAPTIEEDKDAGGRLLRADACDDLAPLTAALCAFDLLRDREDARHVRLLLTRAEEIGFVGAIAACHLGTMPEGSRALLLEASRAYPESPVGAGPIVRVGDRANTFSPGFTASITKLAEKLRDNANADGASADPRPFRFQRKLMPGGMCESSAYLAFGYDSTCVCLPLGNYHNMADLTAVADDKDPDAIANARVGREYVAADDFHDLVTLLTAIGLSLDDSESHAEKLTKLHAQRRRVLTDAGIFKRELFEASATS